MGEEESRKLKITIVIRGWFRDGFAKFGKNKVLKKENENGNDEIISW